MFPGFTNEAEAMIALTEQEAWALCLKWARLIGPEFHPDRRGEDYEPRLCRRHVVDYEHDMGRLLACEGIDPYAFRAEAMRELDLIAEPASG
jgi:hypothetical protein